jgi:hypothetical protein
MTTSKTVQQLRAEWVTPENFRRYGQAIFPGVDGKLLDAEDAQLVLVRFVTC